MIGHLMPSTSWDALSGQWFVLFKFCKVSHIGPVPLPWLHKFCLVIGAVFDSFGAFFLDSIPRYCFHSCKEQVIAIHDEGHGLIVCEWHSPGYEHIPCWYVYVCQVGCIANLIADLFSLLFTAGRQGDSTAYTCLMVRNRILCCILLVSWNSGLWHSFLLWCAATSYLLWLAFWCASHSQLLLVLSNVWVRWGETSAEVKNYCTVLYTAVVVSQYS